MNLHTGIPIFSIFFMCRPLVLHSQVVNVWTWHCSSSKFTRTLHTRAYSKSKITSNWKKYLFNYNVISLVNKVVWDVIAVVKKNESLQRPIDHEAEYGEAGSAANCCGSHREASHLPITFYSCLCYCVHLNSGKEKKPTLP